LPKPSRIGKLGVLLNTSLQYLLRIIYPAVTCVACCDLPADVSRICIATDSLELSVGSFKVVASKMNSNIKSRFDIYVLFPIRNHDHKTKGTIIERPLAWTPGRFHKASFHAVYRCHEI
jgi:hypothetical protein